MTAIIKTSQTLILFFLMVGLAKAEFEVSPNVKISKESQNEIQSDLPLSGQPKTALRKKISKPSENTVNKEFYSDKSKTFRCWQYGELIVAESGDIAPSSVGQRLLNKQGKQLTGFDFGETFCLHIGS